VAKKGGDYFHLVQSKDDGSFDIRVGIHGEKETSDDFVARFAVKPVPDSKGNRRHQIEMEVGRRQWSSLIQKSARKRTWLMHRVERWPIMTAVAVFAVGLLVGQWLEVLKTDWLLAVPDPEPITMEAVTFSELPEPITGMMLYCTDCRVGPECVAGGTGAIAMGYGGKWLCEPGDER
jgi:hypothetical protein